jgi:hypothetical protein
VPHFGGRSSSANGGPAWARRAAATALTAGLDAQAIFAVGFQAAAALDNGDATRAHVLAGEAVELISRTSLVNHPFSAMARVVAGLIQARRGALESATEQIELGVRLADQAGAWHITTYGLLALAEVRQLDHAPAAARRLLARAQAGLENSLVIRALSVSARLPPGSGFEPSPAATGRGPDS